MSEWCQQSVRGLWWTRSATGKRYSSQEKERSLPLPLRGRTPPNLPFLPPSLPSSPLPSTPPPSLPLPHSSPLLPPLPLPHSSLTWYYTEPCWLWRVCPLTPRSDPGTPAGGELAESSNSTHWDLQTENKGNGCSLVPLCSVRWRGRETCFIHT